MGRKCDSVGEAGLTNLPVGPSACHLNWAETCCRRRKNMASSVYLSLKASRDRGVRLNMPFGAPVLGKRLDRIFCRIVWSLVIRPAPGVFSSNGMTVHSSRQRRERGCETREVSPLGKEPLLNISQVPMICRVNKPPFFAH